MRALSCASLDAAGTPVRVSMPRVSSYDLSSACRLSGKTAVGRTTGSDDSATPAVRRRSGHPGTVSDAMFQLRRTFATVDPTSLTRSMRSLYTAYSSRVRSEEHTSELQSLMRNSYAVFCLKKKNKHRTHKD